MSEKRFSVRFSAVGGEATKSALRGIGDAGAQALDRVTAGAGPAEAGLDNVGSAALKARQLLDELAAKAAASAAQMRVTAQATTALQDQINRATGVSSPSGMSAAEMLKQGQALDDLRAKYNPLFGVIRNYRSELSELRAAHLQGALSADEMAAAQSRLRQSALASIAAYKGSTQQIEQMSRAARGGTLRMQQMFYQVNDIGVSLAGGMNPFVVMAQQGTQIAQIYGFGGGGVGGIFRDLGGLIKALPGWLKLTAVALGAAALAVNGLKNEINAAGGEVVNFGDVSLAIFQVIGRGIRNWIKPAVDLIAPWFETAWDAVQRGTKRVGNFLINGIKIAVDGIGTAIGTVPDLFSAAWNSAKAIALDALSAILNGVHDLLSSVASGFNSLFNTNLQAPTGLQGIATDLYKSSTDAWLEANAATGRVGSAWDDFGDRAGETWKSDPMGDFYDAVADQARKNARARKDKDKKGGGRGGKEAKAEKDAVADLIKQLQLELAVLRETDPVKRRMLELSEQLTGATDQQRAMVEGLVGTLDRAENGWEAVGRTLKQYAEDSKRLGGEMGDALVNAANASGEAWAEFTNSGKLNFSDMIRSFASDLARLTWQQHVAGPAMGWISGFMGGFGGDPLAKALSGAGLSGVRSFDGGGHTGYGPRVGGLDGKGGFMAMLHKGERVVDETKGQGAVRVIATHDPGILLQIIDERASAHVNEAERRQSQSFVGNVRRAQDEIGERY